MNKQTKQRMIELKLSNHERKYSVTMTDKERREDGWYDKSDKTANGLTRCIIDFLTWSGHQAERINTMGRRVDNKKEVKDVLGRVRIVGSAEWQKGSGTKGSADISSTISVMINGQKYGLSVKWEVKIKKDVQSVHQKIYENKIKETGGHYFIVHDMEEFLNIYDEFMKSF
jgi:hypothetical protein